MLNHINIRLHFVGDIISTREVKLKRIPTQDNFSNMLTKALPTNKFKHCLQLINMGTAG